MVERRSSGQELVEDATHRVEIGPGIDELAFNLLGRHVRDQSDAAKPGLHGIAARVLSERRQQPEVDEHRPAVGPEEHVRGLDVAVDHRLAVQVRERLAEAADHRQGLAHSRLGGRTARPESSRKSDATPAEQRAVLLEEHDALQAHRAGLDDDTDDREQSGSERDELGRGTQRAEQRVVVRARPAGHQHADDRQRRDRTA